MRPLTDDEAWIVSHNLWLVDHCLRGKSYDDATRDDLRSAGYLGLCYAIRLFNPEKAAWSTYACRWIRRCIQAELEDRGLVHIPRYHLSDGKNPWTRNSRQKLASYAERALNAKRVRWDEGEAVAVLAVSPPAEPKDDDRKRRELVKQHMVWLTDQERTIVHRMVMHDDSLCDVARDLDMKTSTVVTAKKRACLILRRAIAAQEIPD